MEDVKTIVRKIQKLLSLANSDNEAEAKLASAKAQEMLVRYNLSMQEMEFNQEDYEEKHIHTCAKVVAHYRFIFSLLNNYFFVQVYWKNKFKHHSELTGRATYNKNILFFGKKENVQIAQYTFDYLDRVFNRLWKSYKKSKNISESFKATYCEGLAMGLSQKLQAAREMVEEEYGLVVIKDPALQEAVKGAKTSSCKVRENASIEEDGINDGMQIQIAKAIETENKATELLLA